MTRTRLETSTNTPAPPEIFMTKIDHAGRHSHKLKRSPVAAFLGVLGRLFARIRDCCIAATFQARVTACWQSESIDKAAALSAFRRPRPAARAKADSMPPLVAPAGKLAIAPLGALRRVPAWLAR
jgi:hypothetical protein